MHPAPTFLATRRGKLTLAFLCGVALLDFVDASIVNVALPSIRHGLGFSVQNLQWVLSGYLLTYGGFMLLGGRAADLVGRRLVLMTGTSVFGLSSLTAGLAGSEGILIGARLAQGVGAAMMIPAALSILTTSFTEPGERATALGVWGATAGLASALGVFLGGVLAEGPGWRWIFFVNLPVCVLDLIATYRLVAPERSRFRFAHVDALGAILATGGMLLLIYALVRAPDVGWGAARTIGALAGAAALLAAFAVNERRHPRPLFPFSILRIPGLAAADVTQVVAMAGFYSMFFFLTLYMQTVLGFSQIQAGAAYLPATLGVAVASGVSSQLFARTGTRPIIVAGALLGAGGVFWLSRIPVHGSYLTDLLPGLLIMSAGLGAVFVGVTTAAQAGVPPDKAGLAAALINT
jgi:EmrB/QacA subfamily drug resistance transporter